MKYIFLLIFILITVSYLLADINLRVATYNALNFGATSYDRVDDFQEVIWEVDPDIILMQEIHNEDAMELMEEGLNELTEEYASAEFIDGYDDDNILIYKTENIQLVSQQNLQTEMRDISEYRLLIASREIRFYSCHLKASPGNDNEQQRLEEVTILRNHLNTFPDEEEFIIVGDMNFYDSDEPAYQKLIANEENNIGRSEDLTDMVGDWHDNEDFAIVHTQSCRGGNNGGLDDRFDFIFSSYGLNNNNGLEYVENSLTAYGNDGEHFDLGINEGENSAVPENIVSALVSASDHLPVYADFYVTSSELFADFEGEPTSGYLPLNVQFTDLSVGNISEWQWDFQNDGTIDSNLENPSFTYTEQGSYDVKLIISNNDNSVSTLKENYIEIINRAPIVINPLGNLEIDEDETYSEIDLEQVFTDQDGDSLSYSYSGNENVQIMLEGSNVILEPNSNWAGEENIVFSADDGFNRASVSDTLHLQVLPINDPPQIIDYQPTSTDLEIIENQTVLFSVTAEDIDSDLIFDWYYNDENLMNDQNNVQIVFQQTGNHTVFAEVSDQDYSEEVLWNITVNPVSTDEDYQEKTELIAVLTNRDNFRPITKFKFYMSKASYAKIEIFNIKGQRVYKSAEKEFEAGQHSIIWNQKNSENRDVSSGIYMFRFVTNDYQKIGKFIIFK